MLYIQPAKLYSTNNWYRAQNGVNIKIPDYAIEDILNYKINNPGINPQMFQHAAETLSLGSWKEGLFYDCIFVSKGYALIFEVTFQEGWIELCYFPRPENITKADRDKGLYILGSKEIPQCP